MPSIDTCDRVTVVYDDGTFSVKRLYWTESDHAIYALYVDEMEHTLLPTVCHDLGEILTRISLKIEGDGSEM